ILTRRPVLGAVRIYGLLRLFAVLRSTGAGFFERHLAVAATPEILPQRLAFRLVQLPVAILVELLQKFLTLLLFPFRGSQPFLRAFRRRLPRRRFRLGTRHALKP